MFFAADFGFNGCYGPVHQPIMTARPTGLYRCENCQEIFEFKWVKTRFFSTVKSPGRKKRRNGRLHANLSASIHYKNNTLVFSNAPRRLHQMGHSFASNEAVVCINRHARWYQTTRSIAAFHTLEHHKRPPYETQMPTSGASETPPKCLSTPSPSAKTSKNPDENLSIKFQGNKATIKQLTFMGYGYGGYVVVFSSVFRYRVMVFCPYVCVLMICRLLGSCGVCVPCPTLRGAVSTRISSQRLSLMNDCSVCSPPSTMSDCSCC